MMEAAEADAGPREAEGRDWRAVAFPLAIFLLPFLCYLPATLLRGVFYVHDIQYYFYPYHALSAALLKGGELPLWNAAAFSGMPLVGDGQNALFYPPNWLFFLFAPDRVFNHVVLLQFAIAGLAMYACLRELALRREAAFLGAVTFMFCGAMTGRVVHLSIMASAALVPLLFLCLQRFFRTGARRWFALAAVAVALQLLSGHPQVPVYTGVVMLGFALVRGWEKKQQGEGPRWLWQAPALLVAIYAFGAAIAAIQLVPWFELARMSPRAAGASYTFIFRNSATPYDWILMLFPQAFGALRTGLFSEEAATAEVSSRLWEHSVYVGILPLALAVFAGWQALASLRRSQGAPEVGLSRHQQVVAAYLTMVVLFALAMACGRYTPLSHLIYRTPLLGKFRDVERMMILGDFALAGLAAVGLHILASAAKGLSRKATLSRQNARRLIVLAGLAVVLPLAVVALLSLPAVVERARQELTGLLRFDRANALVPIGFCLATAAILIWASGKGASPRLRAGMITLAVLDLGFYTTTFHPLAERDLFRKSPAVLAGLQSDAPFRKATFLKKNDLESDAAKEILAVSWGMPYGIQDINGFNSLQPRRYTDYVFGTEEEDVSYGNLKDRRLLRRESPILSSLNVKYLLVPRTLAPRVGAHFKPTSYESDEVRVYENTELYPRAYFTERWEAADNARAVLETVTADGFDGRKRALLEDVAAASLPAAPSSSDTASVTLGKWGAGVQQLSATTTSARLLVTSEMYFPGWQARIDGTEVPILRANYLFRALVVPPGTHQVEFRYRPGSLKAGATVSALALALAALLVIGRKKSGEKV
jgi:hypothetical protein